MKICCLYRLRERRERDKERERERVVVVIIKFHQPTSTRMTASRSLPNPCPLSIACLHALFRPVDFCPLVLFSQLRLYPFPILAPAVIFLFPVLTSSCILDDPIFVKDPYCLLALYVFARQGMGSWTCTHCYQCSYARREGGKKKKGVAVF